MTGLAGAQRHGFAVCVSVIAVLIVVPGGVGGQPDGIGQTVTDGSSHPCGTVENLTASELTLSVPVQNGTVDGLEVGGERTNARIRNGSLLLDDAQVKIDQASLYESGLVPLDGRLTVSAGGFFLQNATATREGLGVQNRRLHAGDEGVQVSGVRQIQQPPATIVDSSSIERLGFSDLSDSLRFESATRTVLGVARLEMDGVELRTDPLSPTFSGVRVSNGSLTASTVSVPVDDGSLSIERLEVTSGGVTSETDDVDADIEDEIAEFENVNLADQRLSRLLERAC